MESEIGTMLHEQHAVVSSLLSRVACVDGVERQAALRTLSRVLSAHLHVWEALLLPRADPVQRKPEALESGRRVAIDLARTIVEQRGAPEGHDIQTLMGSVLSLLAQERALVGTGFSALPGPTLAALALEADRVFMSLAGPLESNDPPPLAVTKRRAARTFWHLAA